MAAATTDPDAVETAMKAGTHAGVDSAPQLKGAMLILAGFILSMANFMAVLDTAIANVALPHIAGSLAASPNEGTSVITFFAVAEAITIPLTGWLAQRFGGVRVFFFSMTAFGIASALCGLAPSLNALIFFRILQGLAAGPMMPLSQSLLLRIVPPAQHAMATALWAMTIIVAPIVGPLLGGWIADNLGWPWAFYINVPVAILSVFFGWRMLAPHETPTKRVKVDLVGLLLLIFWVGCLQTMLDIGKTHDWFASPLVNLMLISSIIGFAAFCIWEWTAEHPIVDIRVFKNKSLAICTVTIAVVIGLYFGSAVLTPLWMQTNLGYTASTAGQAMAFSGVLAVVMAPIVGRLVTKFDPRALLTFSLTGLTCIMLWRTTFTIDMTFWQVSEPLLVQGMFMPFFFLPLMTVALGTLQPKDIPNGAAMLTFVRTVAGAIATSLMLTTWEDSTVSARAALVGGGLHPEALSTGAGANTVPILNGLVQSQAVMIATNHMFFICAVAMALAAGGVWLTPKVQARAGAGGGGGH